MIKTVFVRLGVDQARWDELATNIGESQRARRIHKNIAVFLDFPEKERKLPNETVRGIMGSVTVHYPYLPTEVRDRAVQLIDTQFRINPALAEGNTGQLKETVDALRAASPMAVDSNLRAKCEGYLATEAWVHLESYRAAIPMAAGPGQSVISEDAVNPFRDYIDMSSRRGYLLTPHMREQVAKVISRRVRAVELNIKPALDVVQMAKEAAQGLDPKPAHEPDRSPGVRNDGVAPV